MPDEVEQNGVTGTGYIEKPGSGTVLPRSGNGFAAPFAGRKGSRKAPRVALAGAGGFGRFHLAALRKLEAVGKCQVVALCDPNPLDPTVSAPSGNGDPPVYSRLEEMLDREDLNHVILSTPPHLHLEQACAVLDRGLSLYLEKPPVTTVEDFACLLRYRKARIAVGFQMIEAPAIRAVKRNLLSGAHGRLRRVSAAGLWPRSTWYYERSDWAGRMQIGGRRVFDGPLTNAFAHLVHSVFFLMGGTQAGFACPGEVRAGLWRARPMEGYDFGIMEGATLEGVRFEIAAAHCATEAVPWTISAETETGARFVIAESDIPSSAGDLLLASHRRALQSLSGNTRVRTCLSDCAGYVGSTSAALRSSKGVRSIPGTIDRQGSGDAEIFHSNDALRFVAETARDGRLPANGPAWLRAGDFIDCGMSEVFPCRPGGR